MKTAELAAFFTDARLPSEIGAAGCNVGLASAVFSGTLFPMTREQLLQRIWIDPGRCSGQPCIRGHRIWVSLILDLLAGGESVESILADYPGITREDVQACIAYGSEMARERFVDIPLEPAGACNSSWTRIWARADDRSSARPAMMFARSPCKSWKAPLTQNCSGAAPTNTARS